MKIYKIDGSFLMEVENLENLKTDLAGKDLTYVNLTDANLYNANLSDVNLRGANLTRANLTDANLVNTNLSYANLSNANLVNANLSYANLSNANLWSANLWSANLSCANLYNADLPYANLRDANLWNANLSGADLTGAKYDSETKFPSPGQVLLANWGKVSDELTTKLMNFDCQNHPVGKKAFDKWVETNECPYTNCQVQRAVNFIERKKLWKYSRTKYSAFQMMKELIAEKMIKAD